MTGNFEVSDQDVQDLVYFMDAYKSEFDSVAVQHVQERLKRMEVLKERLLKVEVNEF